MFLREIKSPVSDLKGAGSQLVSKLSKLGIFCASDLLLYSPRDYEDRSVKRNLKNFFHGSVNCIVSVISYDYFGFGRMKTLKVLVKDEDGTEASLVCYNRPFLKNILIIDTRVRIFGRFDYKYNELQSSTFEVEAINEDEQKNLSFAEGVLPIYPLTEGVGQAILRKLVKQALQRWGVFDDEVPPSIRQKRNLISKMDAIRLLHFPQKLEDIATVHHTLAYEELFYLEVMITRRSMSRKSNSISRPIYKGLLASALIERLPFKLTKDQNIAIEQILKDISSPFPMARLLQGDVGSGKTLVAFVSCLFSIEAGFQAALLAPTELLARQHADNAARLLEPLGIRIAFLTGNVKDSARRPLLASLARGEIDFVIGTHALFSQDVVFKNLGFVVVDEQQRFGVMQRLAMGAKGNKPDVLMMSATPIPRTLALTVYGDLSVSTIKTMPQGRLPIITHLAKTGNEQKVYEFVRKEMKMGHRAYFVYPLVEHSDSISLKDAEAMYEKLSRQIFPEFKGGLIHARLPEDVKKSTMEAFSSGLLSYIVATSVVEVGVDVPEATCMVIEHAERFGLSVLHQLRGRVGRSSLQSYCFLVWSEKLGEDGKRRVVKMKETNDGFEIAEEDLRIRGPGEITGLTQAGSLRLSFADPVKDEKLLEEARLDAGILLSSDPNLISIEGSIVRSVLDRASPFSEKSAATG